MIPSWIGKYLQGKRRLWNCIRLFQAEVAKELQASGIATPGQYENVSVFFTDFKSFTSIADKMPSQELVEELNKYFMPFDNIIEKYNGKVYAKNEGDIDMYFVEGERQSLVEIGSVTLIGKEDTEQVKSIE